MKCERCDQDATLHITEARESAAYGEAHLCEGCARVYLADPELSTVEDRRAGGPHNKEREFQLDISRLIISEQDAHQAIVFREVGGLRKFPIVIGIYEATAIDRCLKRILSPRPLTHDAWLASLVAVGVEIQSTGIDSLTGHTYFASLRLVRPGWFAKPISVDIRPSDAVMMALLANVPLYMPEQLLHEVTTE